MKRLFLKKALSILLVILIGAVLLVFTMRKNQLPAFSFQSTQGEQVDLSVIGKGQNTLVVMFRTNCKFCKTQMTQIHSMVDEFADIKLAFVSKESTEIIDGYRSKIFPSENQHVVFGTASIGDMEDLANDDLAYPYLVWFDETGEEKVRHKGYADPKKILEVIRSN